jgi:hypothetical protein
LSPEDIKRLQDAARAAGDGPSADAGSAAAAGAVPQVSGDIGLGLMQKVELRLDKREGCRKQAEARGLGLLERIQFVRKCME